MPEIAADCKQVGGEDVEVGFGRHHFRCPWHDELDSNFKRKYNKAQMYVA